MAKPAPKQSTAAETPDFSPKSAYPGKGTFSQNAIEDSRLARAAYEKQQRPGAKAPALAEAEAGVFEAKTALSAAERRAEEAQGIQKRWQQLGRELTAKEWTLRQNRLHLDQVKQGRAQKLADVPNFMVADIPTAFGLCSQVAITDLALPIYEKAVNDLAAELETVRAEIAEFAKAHNFPPGSVPPGE